jgi:hypothetical protein
MAVATAATANLTYGLRLISKYRRTAQSSVTWCHSAMICGLGTRSILTPFMNKDREWAAENIWTEQPDAYSHSSCRIAPPQGDELSVRLP